MAGENFGELVTFRNWRGKLWRIAMNYPSSLSKRHHSHVTLNLKTTIIYFIITCCAKMVHAFVVSSVVRGYHKYKDVWSAPIDGRELPCKREPSNPRDTSAVAVFESSPSGELTVGHVPRLISAICSIFIR